MRRTTNLYRHQKGLSPSKSSNVLEGISKLLKIKKMFSGQKQGKIFVRGKTKMPSWEKICEEHIRKDFILCKKCHICTRYESGGLSGV